MYTEFTQYEADYRSFVQYFQCLYCVLSIITDKINVYTLGSEPKYTQLDDNNA